MHKHQLQVIIVAAALLLGLFFLAPTIDPKKKEKSTTAAPTGHSFSMEDFRQAMVAKLPQDKQQLLAGWEAEIKRGDVQQQAQELNQQLATFWKDSVPIPPLHFFYLAKQAELDNTEKSLTFAAHSILEYLPVERNHDIQHWLADKGKELFDKALLLNPANDSTIVGIGGTIIYGAHDAQNNSPMAGILKVREVAERDSTNMFAQYMLGVGGMVSGQYDKAIARFETVVKARPNNIEVLFKLAEANEMMGNTADAADWYERIYALLSNENIKKDLQERITKLRSGSPN